MRHKVHSAREHEVLEIVRMLLQSETFFQDLYRKYRQGRLRFSDIADWVDDRGQSLLYKLKEQCHALFRSAGTGPSYKKAWLLDLTVGSIFHEAMKLKENVYQLQVYRPQYLQYKSGSGKSPYGRDYLQLFERIISKAEQGLKEGIDETRLLFHDATTQLIDFFKGNARNTLLIRFLIENQALLYNVYGPTRVNDFFHLMFKKGILDAYRLAGRSYLQSEHYDLAATYFSKASRLDPHQRDFQFMLNFSLGMDAYYKNAYAKTMAYFKKLLPSKPNLRGKREYLRKVEEICHKIANEWKEERGPRAGRQANLLADQVRRCYDGKRGNN